MASRLFNLARMTVTGAPGVSTITLGAAVPGFLTLDLAGVLNGQFVRYGAKDGNSREIGYATYNASTKQLTARVVENSTTGAILNLTAAAIISLLPSATDFASIAPHCGILLYQSANSVLFFPKNGNKVKCAGKLYDIPAAGIPGGNTNTYVNGVAGQALAANTLYLAALLPIAGAAVPVINFLTNVAHGPSQAVDNEGVEVPNADPNQTVIGMVRTGAGFVANWMNSWFHKSLKSWTVGSSNGSTTATGAPVLLTDNPLYFLSWAGDSFITIWSSQANTGGSFASMNAQLDGVNLAGTYVYGPMNPVPVTLTNFYQAAEGFHALTGVGFASSGSGTLGVNNQYLTALYLG